MLFNSIDFLFFFIVVTGLYFILKHEYRWWLLLASSCYFYMAFVPVYILILGATIVVDYFAGILIERAEGRKRRLFLICSLVANIGVLAIFKYYNFINLNLSAFLEALSLGNPIPYLTILLPIGLSFHTFQAMSYTIEVYRGNQKAERHFGIYALYVMFYPQLVAGPIERPQNLLRQFREVHSFDYDGVTRGLKLMAWGLFMKVVVADRLAIVVNHIYDFPEDFNAFGLTLGTVFFAFQIYCDFAGYSYIAIGAAQVMGFKLMTNFDSPYASKSVSEFWTRWHISLSTWFRDYVYVPLGGNRVPRYRWCLNILVVFLLSGLWHGASWTFVIWGALHGFYLIIERAISRLAKKESAKPGNWVLQTLQVGITFSLVCFGWIFFRAESLDDAFLISTKIIAGLPEVVSKLLSRQSVFQPYGSTAFDFGLSGFLIFALFLLQIISTKVDLGGRFQRSPILVRWSAYVLLIVLILAFGVFDSNQFIYFQF